ncbi:hypothetical protein ZIOFF_052731 [Zingiber officinale]|uniref:Thioesterase domain-containing protein n=1 Tax=Zingiber officinale TaxID=94328 RepID=A0A8J5KSQ2_ZINOF|nr:hypothetical protein ZIOFF_052731 [Zingiber officinale]
MAAHLLLLHGLNHSFVPCYSSSINCLPLRASTSSHGQCPIPKSKPSMMVSCLTKRSPRRSTKAFASIPHLRTEKFFELELKVRDYELDQFGYHMYVCVYVRVYICVWICVWAAQHELLGSIGINADAVARTGNSLAITEMDLQYIAPLRIFPDQYQSHDKFVVRVKLTGISTTRMLSEQSIYKLPDFELIAKGVTITVCLNKSNRPTRVPDQFSSKLLEFFSME